MFILWPLALMYCPVEFNLGQLQLSSVMPFHAAYLLWHTWLLYDCLSLALRQNISKANGSEIHLWWFLHLHLLHQVQHAATPPPPPSTA